MNRKEHDRILVVLQNAYAKGTLAQGWSKNRWLNEFRTSRAGTRLGVVFEEYLEAVRYTNTTPKLGDTAASKLPAQPSHVRKALRRAEPWIVVACGKQSEEVCSREWAGDLWVLPHPCYRVVTDKLLEEAGRLIRWRLYWHSEPGMVQDARLNGPVCRIAFRQQRGGFAIDFLEGHQHGRSHQPLHRSHK